MNLIIFGIPGAGKGTQSTFLAQQYQLQHLSTGDLLRDEIAQNTSIGQKAQTYVDMGQYVPDAIMNEILSKKLKIIKHNFILDGYPRTLSQVQFLEKVLADLHEKIDLVLYLDINEKIVVDRLLARIVCPKCKRVYNLKFLAPNSFNRCDDDGTTLIQRSDDRDVTKITVRLNTYQKETKPLINYYQNQGLLKMIDSNQDDQNVKDQLTTALLAKGQNYG